MLIAGAIIIGIGIAVLLVALGLNGWSFTPSFETKEFTSTQENTALSVDLKTGKLKIEYHDRDDIQVLYPSAKGYETTITESHGKLTVEGNKHHWYSFNWWTNFPETVIKIPRDQITTVEIEINAGTVELPDGAFEKVKVEVNAGTCNIGKITDCYVMDIHMNAGTVNIEGAECDKLSCKVNAGTVNLRKIDSADTKVEVNAGTANLSFMGAIEEYSAEVTVSAGSCNGLSNRTGGSDTITVKVAAGSVNVSFQG